MAISPSTTLLRRGKGHLLFEQEGTTGYIHLGNVPDFKLTKDLTEDPHYSSMSAEKFMDVNEITEKAVSGSFTLEEFSPTNMNLTELADGVISSSQTAGYLNATSVTTLLNKFVDIGKQKLTYLKVTHGTVTGGPFDAGETITGGTSSVTAKVVWVGSGYVECVNASGAFTTGETITGGTSSATATLTGTETMNGVIAVDAATPTVRYVQGTHYFCIPEGGYIREDATLSPAHTLIISADYPALTISAIRALSNSMLTGKLKFISTNATGPRWNVDIWKAQIKGGELSMISEDRASIPVEFKALADLTNHPTEPFYRLTGV